MVWLVLILGYASIFSALPQVRGAVEVTEMGAFRHPLFVSFIALFCVTLIVTTLTRIRFNLINLGVWTVHTGLLLLGGGAAWYFGTKVEGDVLLRSPQIELISISGTNSRSIAEVLANKGERWSQNMPAFGGKVNLEVIETAGAGTTPVQSAKVRVTLGDQPAKEVALSVPDSPLAAVSDRLALRLQTFKPASTFYDDEVAALHYRKMGEKDAGRGVAAMYGLPLHRERYLDEGYVLRDVAGAPSPTKRTSPVIAGTPISTAWFEQWRMPLALETPDLPFEVTVTGYVPYIRDMELTAAGGGNAEYPAMTYSLVFGRSRVRESLFAFDPGLSLSKQANLEFRWAQSAAEQMALFSPMQGSDELVIETLEPPTKKIVSITEGAKIKVEGTDYELSVIGLDANWPLMSPGFEKARSPVARIDVKSPSKSYNRTVVQRFPQLSQDIDEKGVRHREGPYDPNLKLTYRSSSSGWAILAAGPGLTPMIGMFGLDGKVRPIALDRGKPAAIPTSEGELQFTLEELFDKGQMRHLPVIEPIELRRPGLSREASAIRVKLKGKGDKAGWSESRWIPFSAYPDEEDESHPMRVSMPGDPSVYELIYSRMPRALECELAPQKLTTTFFPGRMSATAWRSDFLVADKGGNMRPEYVETNQTATVGQFTFFQSGAAKNGWSYTVLGVGTREAIAPQVIGCFLITLGSMYAFYVKPILKRRKAEQAKLLAANRRGSVMPDAPDANEIELVEVRS